MTSEKLDRLKKESSILLIEDDPDHVELAIRALEKNGVANKSSSLTTAPKPSISDRWSASPYSRKSCCSTSSYQR